MRLFQPEAYLGFFKGGSHCVLLKVTFFQMSSERGGGGGGDKRTK